MSVLTEITADVANRVLNGGIEALLHGVDRCSHHLQFDAAVREVAVPGFLLGSLQPVRTNTRLPNLDSQYVERRMVGNPTYTVSQYGSPQACPICLGHDLEKPRLPEQDDGSIMALDTRGRCEAVRWYSHDIPSDVSTGVFDDGQYVDNVLATFHPQPSFSHHHVKYFREIESRRPISTLLKSTGLLKIRKKGLGISHLRSLETLKTIGDTSAFTEWETIRPDLNPFGLQIAVDIPFPIASVLRMLPYKYHSDYREQMERFFGRVTSDNRISIPSDLSFSSWYPDLDWCNRL
jgi:hypothetical protein